jgi:glycosyltransferase involved in cell wall biosynthesis
MAAGAAVTVFTRTTQPGQAEVLPRDERVKVVRGDSKELRAVCRESVARGNGLLMHDFGMWLPANHTAVSVSQELEIPLVISPCGMLASWALKHKRWKKRLAWWLYQKRDLRKARMLVATAEQEVRDLQRWNSGKPVALIPNGVVLPRGKRLETTDQRQRTVVFLGRIHPVKGLKNLVEAWSQVRPEGWRCVLAGPDEAGHKAQLEALIAARQLKSDFGFPGLMGEAEKWELLRGADLFVLPSFTENFGVAAAEALACGVPVIATKGTPWGELEEWRCGWWVEMGVEPLAAALREATSLAEGTRREMGGRGQRLVQEKYAWPRIAGDLLATYQWVLGSGRKPSGVVESNQ